LSDEEAMLITRTATLQDATTVLNNETSAIYTITLGKEGTLLGFHQKNSTIGSIAIKPVDTTGAGDAFVGAVLYQLCDKTLREINQATIDDWNAIVTNANKAGARTCEYLGAMEAFKHLNNQIFQ
jgi:fructokinase